MYRSSDRTHKGVDRKSSWSKEARTRAETGHAEEEARQEGGKMTEKKERVNRNVCVECENEQVCFCILHFLHRLTGRVCRQGRKKKQFREKQATLEETAKDQT